MGALISALKKLFNYRSEHRWSRTPSSDSHWSCEPRNLAYRVDGSKVTLFGQVRDPKLKSDAERAVKSIEGVSAIDNQIEVMPLSSMDDQTRMAVYRAIYSKSSLQRYQLGAVPPIHIIVKNGDVTLEGVVANEMDKNVAGIAANGVGSVHKVNNNLRTDK